MPDQPFVDLFRDTEHLSWPPTAQVRERGRRRTRQTRIAAALAAVVAVALVATGAVALAGGREGAPTPVLPATGSPTPTPTPTPTPSATSAAPRSSTTSTTPAAPPSSPSRTPSAGSTKPAIPAAAMLRLSDLPAGFTMAEDDIDGDWSLESVSIYCREAPTGTSNGRLAQRTVSFDSPTDRMIQRVVRFSIRDAAREMDAVRALFTDCKPRGATSSMSVLADGLGAGDESLLVGSDIDGVRSRWLVVRQGDLVAQVALDMDTTPKEALRYARPVAQRLCAGTDTC
ncbi:hypothetical protein OG992_21555 [Micromonospora sp. NBC_00362]|uniref:hypothetical protein n=1 Tax=Micromonospora sp. NBC_00362 TaxID=2975975 RepID=UPI00224CE6DC|nr:hypothetical protein [Micromonospora sp. NBC_00362]MCX5119777.1 hypothetical protein [Micromonospora sp. NBC_00362]